MGGTFGSIFQVRRDLCRFEKIRGEIGDAIRILKKSPGKIDRASECPNTKGNQDEAQGRRDITEYVV